jgi:hypothetical protein
MKKCFVSCAACTLASSCCPTCIAELDRLLSIPLPAQQVICAAPNMIGTALVAHG